ncbi:MAG: peptidylprolyl isomerase [Nanoarchaeota archaeon]|nr:peptidylprolyl isomerase [Nanoarchaeota archaeon]
MEGKKHHTKEHHAHVKHPHARARKSPVQKYVFGAVVFVVLVAVIAGLIYLASKSGELRLSRQREIAAVVNDEQITTAYLDEQYDRVPETYREFITKSMLLNQTINEVLLLQEAKKQGIEVTKADVEDEISSAMEKAGVTEDQLEERLKEQNISRDYLEELYMKQLTINQLLEKVVFTNIKVADSEIEGFYSSRIRAMHILVETEEEANSMIEQLKKVSLGKIESKFSELAKAESIDPSAATNGGDLGEFSRGQMVPAFEAAAFALEDYAFTAEPVQTQFGYHIILRLPKTQNLEEQYDSINELLLTQKKAQAVPIYLDQLRSKAKVEVLYTEEVESGK